MMQMQLMWPSKDPSDIADFQIDWSGLLETDTIATSTWTAPAGFTITSQTNTATTTTVWLAAGSVAVHKITNRITTAGGRTFERSVRLTVEEL